MHQHGHGLAAWAKSLLAAVGMVALAPRAVAQGMPTGESLVRVSARAGSAQVSRGETFVLAFQFTIQPHWHIYWANAGETGAPTSIRVTAPEGFEVGEVLWQRPLVMEGEFTSYGYEDAVTLFVPITAGVDAAAGEAALEASIDWLVCKEMCLSGAATSRTIVTVDGAVAPATPAGEWSERLKTVRFDDAALERLFLRLPKRLETVEGGEVKIDGQRIVLTGPAAASGSAEHEVIFVPNHSPGVETKVEEATVRNGVFRVVLSTRVNAANTGGEAPVVRGVVVVGSGEQSENAACYDIVCELPSDWNEREKSSHPRPGGVK